MSANTLHRLLVPTAARRLVRAFAILFPLAAMAAAGNPSWTQQQELAASDGAFNDQFGFSVSVSGNTAVIGADGRNSGQGAAYVFVQSAGVWSPRAELTASDGVANDHFGHSVSVSGNTVVIGAYEKNDYQEPRTCLCRAAAYGASSRS